MCVSVFLCSQAVHGSRRRADRPPQPVSMRSLTPSASAPLAGLEPGASSALQAKMRKHLDHLVRGKKNYLFINQWWVASGSKKTTTLDTFACFHNLLMYQDVRLNLHGLTVLMTSLGSCCIAAVQPSLEP